MYILDLRYVLPLRNWSASLAIGVENQGKILDYLTPLKIRGGVGKSTILLTGHRGADWEIERLGGWQAE